MNLVADIDARRVECVENRRPALGKFIERRLDEPRGPLRPRIHVRPGERAGEARMVGKPEMRRRLGSLQQLTDGPLLARRRIAAHRSVSEAVEQRS